LDGLARKLQWAGTLPEVDPDPVQIVGLDVVYVSAEPVQPFPLWDLEKVRLEL
jgi:hypothetical protein